MEADDVLARRAAEIKAAADNLMPNLGDAMSCDTAIILALLEQPGVKIPNVETPLARLLNR